MDPMTPTELRQAAEYVRDNEIATCNEITFESAAKKLAEAFLPESKSHTNEDGLHKTGDVVWYGQGDHSQSQGEATT